MIEIKAGEAASADDPGNGPRIAAPWQRIAASALALLSLTIAIYWRLSRGEFVWDDIVCLRDQTWLFDVDVWRKLFSRNFCELTNFFRPAAVLLWTLQLRAFDAAPAAMHVVSLAIHLLNCVLVGMLAATFLATHGRRRSTAGVALPMLLYALHPALVEPIAWISAQTELEMTAFVLLGMLANLRLSNAPARAATVAACFFFAACAKETAVAFPLAILLCDWMQAPVHAQGATREIRALLRRQWGTYAAIVGAGLAYLWLRDLHLGYLVNTRGSVSLAPLARLQEVSFVYLQYWRMIVWPMLGLGPVHVIDEARFSMLNASSLAVDAGALALAGYAFAETVKRRPLGLLVAVVTVLLLPVVHILPVTFDESLYHDRYVMAPLAMAAALLPLAIGTHAQRKSIVRSVAMVAVTAWLLAAVVNIRTNLPLWSSDTTLWQWALRLHPESVSARENLFASYVVHDDPRAMGFARALVADAVPCPTCLLNAAYFAMREHDTELAAAALSRLQTSSSLAHDAGLQAAFHVARGKLSELNGDVDGGATAYAAAIAADPRDPAARMQLALLLARHGDEAQARAIEQAALALFAPDQRASQHEEFEHALRESANNAH